MSYLVQRSDVGEFRRRYKWLALVVVLAFTLLVVRLFQHTRSRRDLYQGVDPGLRLRRLGGRKVEALRDLARKILLGNPVLHLDHLEDGLCRCCIHEDRGPCGRNSETVWCPIVVHVHPQGASDEVGHLGSEHVAGSGRRKLHFDVWSGDVWLAFPEGENAEIRNSHGG